jgi:hypothetical protein
MLKVQTGCKLKKQENMNFFLREMLTPIYVHGRQRWVLCFDQTFGHLLDQINCRKFHVNWLKTEEFIQV